MSNGLFKDINFTAALVAAALALSAGPVLAGQRPADGAPSHGAAVERGGGGGGNAPSNPSTTPAASPSSGSTAGSVAASTPSAAASSPSFSGAARHAAYAEAPQHRTSGASGGNAGSGSGTRGSGGQTSGGGERAVPRGTAPSGGNSTARSSGGNTTTHSAAPANTNSATANRRTAASNADRAVPNWSRPRGDRPATGTAVARTHPPIQNGGVVIIGGQYYNPFFPYGVGYPGYGLGLGFGLYDPWYDPFMYSGYGYGYGGYAAGGSDDYYPYNYGAQQQTPEDLGQGAIRLKVKPRDAKVYVDGVFMGEVDSFDGAFQKLNVGAGHHKVEVRADGYETAEFDVLVTPDQTVTYQGELKRIQ
jgi:hypothetical protein